MAGMGDGGTRSGDVPVVRRKIKLGVTTGKKRTGAQPTSDLARAIRDLTDSSKPPDIESESNLYKGLNSPEKEDKKVNRSGGGSALEKVLNSPEKGKRLAKNGGNGNKLAPWPSDEVYKMQDRKWIKVGGDVKPKKIFKYSTDGGKLKKEQQPENVMPKLDEADAAVPVKTTRTKSVKKLATIAPAEESCSVAETSKARRPARAIYTKDAKPAEGPLAAVWKRGDPGAWQKVGEPAAASRDSAPDAALEPSRLEAPRTALRSPPRGFDFETPRKLSSRGVAARGAAQRYASPQPPQPAPLPLRRMLRSPPFDDGLYHAPTSLSPVRRRDPMGYVSPRREGGGRRAWEAAQPNTARAGAGVKVAPAAGKPRNLKPGRAAKERAVAGHAGASAGVRSSEAQAARGSGGLFSFLRSSLSAAGGKAGKEGPARSGSFKLNAKARRSDPGPGLATGSASGPWVAADSDSGYASAKAAGAKRSVQAAKGSGAHPLAQAARASGAGKGVGVGKLIRSQSEGAKGSMGAGAGSKMMPSLLRWASEPARKLRVSAQEGGSKRAAGSGKAARQKRQRRDSV